MDEMEGERPPACDYILSNRMRKIIENADRESCANKAPAMSSHHLLIALLEDPECLAMQVLRNLVPKVPTAHEARAECRKIIKDSL